MQDGLLKYLCDPRDRTSLSLESPVRAADGSIVSGVLVSESGNRYRIRDSIPRFTEESDIVTKTVESFGDEWNHFNFDEFKINWLTHTVTNTFGSHEYFRDKVIVDCGAGSGAQSKWMAEYGAKHVIALELSHSVDDVMQRNLDGLPNVDIVQCSIDQPPIKEASIVGLVICHNVIQHTPSVDGTARALWRLVAPGGEFAFNCYQRNDKGLLRKIRLQIYDGLRDWLSIRSFDYVLNYARVMAVFRLIPVLGWVLEKAGFLVRGHVPKGPNYFRRAFRSTLLNTYDCFGSHAFQHLKSDEEIRALVKELQPDPAKVANEDAYFRRPPPIGIALRIFR